MQFNTLPNTMIAGDIRDQFKTKHKELSTLNDELSALESAANSLSLLGIDWSKYDESYRAAAAILGSEQDIA
ncbi:MAG: hypothetical protein Q8K97_03090, partial [Pseudohongiella sp.]|nr:hypothetical protein [Pseudohongiella sp.]